MRRYESERPAKVMVVLPPTAAAWQSLFNIYLTLGVIGGGLTIGFLVYFAVKYRGSGQKGLIAQHKRGEEKVVVALVVLMVLALVIAAYFTISVAQFQSTPPDPSEAIHINVIGRQWSWTFQYPNGIVTVGELRIPANTTIILNVTSTDVFHDFGIPDFKVKADAILGYYQPIWLIAPRTGNYSIYCFELCGVGHAFMTAKMVVMQPSSYQQWYASGGK